VSLNELNREYRLLLIALKELVPGLAEQVCCDTRCPTQLAVPHMANDFGPHPHLRTELEN
jgi:hypothetical protein